jgi:hypothetical protein
VAGTQKDFLLLHQHALVHYLNAIELFGSPNGTCTSQTKVKHRPVVKQPWCQSSHNKPLPQMMQTITHLDKLTALRQVFRQHGMLVGSVTSYMASQFVGKQPPILPWMGSYMDLNDGGDDDDSDVEPASGPRTDTEIWFPSQCHKFFFWFPS